MVFSLLVSSANFEISKFTALKFKGKHSSGNTINLSRPFLRYWYEVAE